MGRPVGKLVGLTADVKGEVTAIQVAHSDGEVAQHQIKIVKVLEDRLILQQSWRVEAEDLQRERDIIVRRRQALDLLLNDGDIEQSEFDQQKTRYEDLEKDIKDQCEALLGTLKQVESKLDQQISDLQGALTNNKMLYSSSEIEEQTYHTVTESIRSGLETARKERQDLDNIRRHLNGVESTAERKVTQASTLKSPPSDVVVIKINELA
jgi:chromosome segregation ATPase